MSKEMVPEDGQLFLTGQGARLRRTLKHDMRERFMNLESGSAGFVFVFCFSFFLGFRDLFTL